MQKDHAVLLIVNLVVLMGFAVTFVLRMNYEFLIYVGVVTLLLCLVGGSLRRIAYTRATLVGLTVWASLHLAGGGLNAGGGRLYDLMLVPLSETYPILRFDQLVHAWGFGVSVLVAYCLLHNMLQRPFRNPIALGLVLVMTSLGFGALNEIVEFAVDRSIPESGVGGYINTSLDLCANLVGALLGLIYVRVRYWPARGSRAEGA